MKPLNFKKGSAELLVLHILNTKGDSYGYEISQLIKTVSEGDLFFPEGSLYPTFYKLIEQGCISDEKRQSGKRKVRVYYHIEKKGIERLEAAKEEYIKTNNAIMKILENDFKNVEGMEDES